MSLKILVGLIALALILSGCVEEEVSEPTSKQYMLDEYDKYVDTMNEDLTRLNAIIDKRDTTYAMVMADEDLTVEETNQLIDITNEYNDEYNLIKPHLTEFKKFIKDNELELKNAGIDTYQIKKDIDEVSPIAIEEMEEIKDILKLLDEYDKYVDTMDDDLTRLDAISDKWNTAYTMAVADEDLTVEEVNHLISIANEYNTEYNFIEPHLTSFKKFIEDNEMELMDAGIDTYQDKKYIEDANSIAIQNIEIFISNLENAIAYVETSEQEEDIMEIIDILKLLAFI